MKNAAPILLVVLGLMRIVGEVTRIDVIRGVAAATGASPEPKVFSTVQGLEAYSSRFFIETGDRRVEMTPDLYARVRGPYNRRTVYGGVLAYAPVLPAALRDPVLRYAMCGDAPLLRELGIERGAGEAAVVLEPRVGPAAADVQTRFVAPCR